MLLFFYTWIFVCPISSKAFLKINIPLGKNIHFNVYILKDTKPSIFVNIRVLKNLCMDMKYQDMQFNMNKKNQINGFSRFNHIAP